MIYNTVKCQEIFRERFIGDDESRPFKDYRDGKSIKDVAVTNEDLSCYKKSKKQDMSSFYYKSLLSYAEGLDAISRGNYTWATIKLYYSVYFSLRCSLLCRNVILVRANGNLYYLKLETNATYKKPKEMSDHGGTIDVYTALFKTTDFLCSNLVEDKFSYSWIKQCREIVNYRDEVFHDPDVNELWEKVVSDIEKNGIEKTIATYVQNKSSSCFSPETAILAIPTYRIMATAQEMKNEGIASIEERQKLWVKNILDGLVDDSFLESIIF